MASKFFFLTQLMRSQGLLLDVAISWILLSKNNLLVLQMADLKAFQLLMSPVSWYLLIHMEHCSFHHSLECLVIFLVVECVDHTSLKIVAKSVVHLCMSDRFFSSEVSIFLMPFKMSLMNASSSLLSFFIALKVTSTFSSFMPISMKRGT